MAYGGITPTATPPTATTGGYKGISATPTAPAPAPAPAPNPLVGGLKAVGGDIAGVLNQPRPQSVPVTPESYLGGVKDWGTNIIQGWKDFGSTLVHPQVTNTNFATNAGVDVAQSGVSFVKAFFTPVSDLFTKAASIPGPIGAVADGVNKLFGVAGVEGGDAMEGAVQALPFVSQQTKDAITPIMKDIGSLGGQIILGKGGDMAKTEIVTKTKSLISTISNDPTLNEHAAQSSPPAAVAHETPTVGNEIKAPSNPLTPSEAPPVPTQSPVLPESPQLLAPTTMKASDLVSHEGAPDAARVAQYKADIQAGKPIEPLKVIQEGNKYGIEDGKHRFQAYQDLGINDIPVKDVSPNSIDTKTVGKYQTPGPRAEDIAQHKDTLTNMRAEIQSRMDIQKSDPARELLKHYGKNDPRFENLDSMFARNVKKNGGSNLKRLDSIVSELGFKDVQDAHDAVLSYLDEKQNIADLRKTYLETKQAGPQPHTKQATEDTPPLSTYAEDAATQQKLDAQQPSSVNTDTPVQKRSKIGKSVEQKAIEARLTKGFDKTAGYDAITIKDQAERATNFVNSGIDNVREILRGDKPLPEGLKGTALITAVEEHLAHTADAQLAYELANSPLISETSHAAQELRLASERNPDSVTAKFNEIKKARQAALEKKGGVQKVTERVKKDIQKEITKTASKRPTWEEFTKQLTCQI